jgi:hypothetical protein
MKKIKWTIMALTIVLSVGGAFASRPHQGDCRTAQQYYLTAGGYNPTGVWGTNYVCDQSTNVCTYIFDGVATFYPCRIGQYHSIMATDTKPKTKTPIK